MKRLLFLLLGVLLLGTGGLGGAAMFGYGPLAPLFGTEKKQQEPPPPPPDPKARAVTIGTFVIPVIQNHSISRQIGLDVDLKIDPAQNEKVSRELTRVHHEFLLRLYELVPRHSDAHSAIDRQAIHDELLKITNDIYGDGVVWDVVIKSIYDR